MSLALALVFAALCCPGIARGLQKENGVRIVLNAPGPLEVIVNGHRSRIAEEALSAWNLGNSVVAYTGRDGAGGFENEGQSLYLYDLASSRRRKIMSEVFMIDAVEQVKTSTGSSALLVSMRDGGLGASHVAVVDPRRGEVFIRRLAEITGRKGDIISLGIYRPEGVDKPDSRPYKTERYDLKSLLNRPVISSRAR